MQNDNELIGATKEHKDAIDAATAAIKQAAAQPEPAPPALERVQRLAMYTCDVPWPAGKTMRELEIEVPYPAEYAQSFFHVMRPNPLLVTPGEEPKMAFICRMVFTGSPDAPRVKRHIIAQPTGSAFGFPEGMLEEMRPVLVDVVMNLYTGDVVALWLDPPDTAEPTEIPFFEAKPLEQRPVDAELVPSAPEVAPAPEQPTES